MPFQNDSFGHKSYDYKPAWEKDVERSPDKQPSHSEFWYLSNDRDTTLIMEVKGLGCITMRATGGHDDGKLRFEGLALVTSEEILFDKE